MPCPSSPTKNLNALNWPFFWQDVWSTARVTPTGAKSPPTLCELSGYFRLRSVIPSFLALLLFFYPPFGDESFRGPLPPNVPPSYAVCSRRFHAGFFFPPKFPCPTTTKISLTPYLASNAYRPLSLLAGGHVSGVSG